VKHVRREIQLCFLRLPFKRKTQHAVPHYDAPFAQGHQVSALSEIGWKHAAAAGPHYFQAQAQGKLSPLQRKLREIVQPRRRSALSRL